MGPRETVTLGFLAVFVFWIGFYPKPLLTIMDKSVTHLLQQVETGKQVAGEYPTLVKVGAGCKQVSRGVAESAEKP
jgi:NADH-quinone oxidoreductase subunit M